MKQNNELTRLSELIGEPIAREEPLSAKINPHRLGAVLAKSTILKCEISPAVESSLNNYKFQKIINSSVLYFLFIFSIARYIHVLNLMLLVSSLLLIKLEI